MQTQSCLKLAEEAEKERKEMAERISGRAEEMKASYKKFLTEVQSSSSRDQATKAVGASFGTNLGLHLSASKVTFPEMAKSVARAIDGLRSRYNIPATPA
uniref:Uncharacterized protein n=1 Tax=Aegilops tauschii TaxID=37682 RepID=R7WAJ1_AEGTA